MRINEGTPSATIPDWSKERKITLKLLRLGFCCHISEALGSIRCVKLAPMDESADTKILGLLAISDHVVIGANAVVLSDVPSNSVAIRKPARVTLREYRAAS
jgi:hypothetical protein